MLKSHDITVDILKASVWPIAAYTKAEPWKNQWSSSIHNERVEMILPVGVMGRGVKGVVA